MHNAFRVVTWNVHGATADSGRGVWEYLLELNPDVALLQEVGGIPEHVSARFDCYAERAMTNTRPQCFSTAVLVRGRIGRPVPLSVPEDWAAKELKHFGGNLVAMELLPDKGPALKAVSAYSPAWPVDRARLSSFDVTRVCLTQNADVWVADLLWASLQHQQPDPSESWIVAGDLNLSVTFDSWGKKPRGNQEYLDRMKALGFVECLAHKQQKLTPTFRHPRGSIKHQMDHLFVTNTLAGRLVACDTGSEERVFGASPRLSDHLPIVADFTASHKHPDV